jgi:hypothetical protein
MKKHNVIIHMGASRWDVIVHDAARKRKRDKPVVFDLYSMTKDQRREFHREFMRAYRAS